MTRYCQCQQWDGSFMACPLPECVPLDENADMPDNHPDAEVEPNLGACPYYRQDGSMGHYGPNACSFGCWEEPQCKTCEPEGGWPEPEPLLGGAMIETGMEHRHD